jgi:AcrR family transcriptional regulator
VIRKADRSRSIHFWIDIGLRELAASGPEALTVEALCRKAGKTKGSFYAHFAGHDDFLFTLVRCWRERDTEAPIAATEAETTTQGQIATLNDLASQIDARLERGIRTLADRHPAIAERMAEVDEIRISYLARLIQTACHRSNEEARDLALIEYAAYLGFQALRPRIDLNQLTHLQGVLTKLIYIEVADRERHQEG